MTYWAMKDVNSMNEMGFTGRVGGTEGLPGKFQRSKGPACKSKMLGQARGEPSSEAHYRALFIRQPSTTKLNYMAAKPSKHEVVL